MLPVAVQIVERLASNREDHLTDVMGIVNGKRVLCTRQPVPVVEKKPVSPSNLAKIVRFTVAIVINHARLSAQTLVDLVGKRDVPDYCKS